MVTSVNYCFSDLEQTSEPDEYLATFAIYRLDNQRNDLYRPVSSAITLRVTEAQVQTSSFGCSNFILNQPVPIEAGDVLGVCVFDPPGSNTHSLNVVGALGGSPSGSLWRIRVGSFPGGVAPITCTETSVPPFVSNGDTGSTRAVYLYANIGKIFRELAIVKPR